MKPILKTKLAQLPDSPGVYLYKDATGEIIYIGKASSLRSRVRSYFSSSHDVPRLKSLVDNIRDIDYIITRSEFDALILENTLIKKHYPRYNVRLKDDKGYPFLKITAEQWPRLALARRVADDGARYFGPYSSVAHVRHTMHFLQRVFPLRMCSKMKDKPCMYHHIGKCGGPCGGDVSEEEYADNIQAVSLFLEGRDIGTVNELKDDMRDASSKMQFERACVLRDRIAALESIAGKRQHVVGVNIGDADIIGVAQGRFLSMVETQFLRDGAIVGHDTFVLRTNPEDVIPEILSAFLKQFYSEGGAPPPIVLVAEEPVDRALLEGFFTQRRCDKVRISKAQRGPRRKLVDIARDNAAQRLVDEEKQDDSNRRRNEELTKAIANRIGLRRVPSRIIGMDISTIMGDTTVGCVVTFRNALADKNGYRKFIIRDVTLDDFGALREVARRYFIRVNEEREPRPDLIIVDGGKGQVSAVGQGIAAAGFENAPTIMGIAKESRISHIHGQDTPIIFSPDEPAYALVYRVDQEAHRFVISFHRKKKGKKMFE